MNYEQKAYIEEHIDLIRTNEWDDFFKFAPPGTGGVLYEAGFDFMSKLNYVPKSTFFRSNIQTIDVPDCVTRISDYAFSSCHSLMSVTMGDGVTNIGAGAFWDCTSLDKILIPESVTRIGEYAFSKCNNLRSIVIPDNITSIGIGTFWLCKSLTSIVIPSNVTNIGFSAFEHCISLANIIIPNSITSIYNDAFCDCGKLEIKYDGTVEAWKNLIGNNTRVFKNTTYTCTCTDGVVKKLR